MLTGTQESNLDTLAATLSNEVMQITQFLLILSQLRIKNNTVKSGFLFLRQKRLSLGTSCTQNYPESKRLKFDKLVYLYLKCILFLKVNQHVLIFETQFFSKMSRHILIFEATCFSKLV